VYPLGAFEAGTRLGPRRGARVHAGRLRAAHAAAAAALV